jgi:Cu(I)/Ag(I) efflux system membrane protein CusA/SilA
MMKNASSGLLSRIVGFCIDAPLVVFLLTMVVLGWGVAVAPFDWNISWMPRDPVPVDAIPDIGENQQIVFTPWKGRSPQDMQDQVTYPLTVALLGLPDVKTVRSFSMFGYSSIYVIFEDGSDFYDSRSRVLEKLSSLPSGTLPADAHPTLGPDATALGQVFWYTLEGQNEQGEATGGWDLDALRSLQDWYVRYGLQSARGVSEVASVGGFVREYQVDVDPVALQAHGVGLGDVFKAVRMSNLDVGAGSMEINQVEYFIRGIGFIKSVEDLANTVVKVSHNVPIYVRDVATVEFGPATRRGVLDKGGAEVVGGVVVVRYGENPLSTIKAVKEKIRELSGGLPEKMLVDYRKIGREGVDTFARGQGFEAFQGETLNQERWLDWYHAQQENDRPEWLSYSKVTLVPFYDRSELINETLHTLNEAISQELLITILVVLVLIRNFSSVAMISGLLPLAVLMTFIAMKLFGVDANIVALSGIVIAIGTMVDMGVVICENVLRRLDAAEASQSRSAIIQEAVVEVGRPVLTAVATTIISFLPVFAMQEAEGKLFKPLAFTKTFALLASITIALTVLPAFARWFFGRYRPRAKSKTSHLMLGFTVVLVGVLLTREWLPLGPESSLIVNLIFVGLLVGTLLFFVWCIYRWYVPVMGWALAHKRKFFAFPLALVVFALCAWLGINRILFWAPQGLRNTAPIQALAGVFPGFQKEFMPRLEEGSFLYMPTTMPHASIGEARDVLQKMDRAIAAVHEVETVVGKLGRAESPLDPAPVSMFETVINYFPEFLLDAEGKRLRFSFDPDEVEFLRSVSGEKIRAADGLPYEVRGKFERDGEGALIPKRGGHPFRLWRPALDPDVNEGREAWAGIQTVDDIWAAIQSAAKIPGTTSASRLEPIGARIIMLQSGMRTPIGLKIMGPDLDTIEKVAMQVEQILKTVPQVDPATVFADRMIGKPYLEINIDRGAIARHGIHMQSIQEVIEVAVGGKTLSYSVEGRERYPIRVRYQRELRDSIEALERVLIPAVNGAHIPLTQLASVDYVRGPQVIKSEDTFLTGYVLLDKMGDWSDGAVVDACQKALTAAIASGGLEIPDGVTYRFSGTYENQQRAAKRLAVGIPAALLFIVVILYLQFRSVITSMMVFGGIFIAWSGGFLLLWLYGQPWFLDVSIFGANAREIFQIHPFNLSVAVWVGFLALFGIASDDGVLIGSILCERFKNRTFSSVEEIRATVIEGGRQRLRPALMTSATTILALLPVLSSVGRGSDIMIPMAIPTMGGMSVAVITIFTFPCLYCAWKEWQFKHGTLS